MHVADDESQYCWESVVRVGASSVLFFLIFEANPTFINYRVEQAVCKYQCISCKREE